MGTYQVQTDGGTYEVETQDHSPVPPQETSSPSIDLNAPTLPIKEWGGKLLDATFRLTGAGNDRSIIKANLPTLYGTMKSYAGKAQELTSPVNVGLGLGMAAAGPEVATAATGAFAINALTNLFKSAPQKYQEYKDAIAKGDVSKQAEIVNDAGLDIGMTALAGHSFIKNLELPSLSDIGTGIKNVAGAVNVKPRADELLNSIPSKIESQTGVSPMDMRQAGQIMQPSFERGFGTQEKGFEQAHQDQIAAQNKAISDAATAKEALFNKGINDVAGKYGPEPIGLQEAGQSGQNSIKTNLENAHSTGSKIYKMLDAVSGEAPASLGGEPLKGLGVIEDIFKQRNITSANLNPKAAAGYEMFKGSLESKYGLAPSEVRQILEQTDALSAKKFTSETLSPNTLNAYRTMDDIAGKLQNPNLTVHDLSSIASDVDRYAYRGDLNDPIKKVYQAVSGALKEDVANGAEAAGFGDLANNARAAWRKYKVFEGAPTTKVALGVPEKIIPKIAQANSPTAVNELMGNMSPAAQNDFRRGILDNYREKAGNDPGAMSKLLNSKTAETNRAIFGSDYQLLDRYAKFGKLIDEAKSVKPEIPKNEPYTPTETRAAGIMRGQDAGNIIDGLIGNGGDETRIKAAINGMDQPGRAALKSGVFQKIKDNPQILNKISDPILRAVYGDDAKLFSSYRDILNARDSTLKSSILKDIRQIVMPGFPYAWTERASVGLESLKNKINFPATIAEPLKTFSAPRPQSGIADYINEESSNGRKR